jgi:hypothetical protein
MRFRHAFLLPAAVALAIVPGAASGRVKAILHEPIPADPTDDSSLGVSLAGDMPAMIDTPSGLVHAPDPRRPNLPTDKAYGPNSNDVPSATYMADRDTRRPNTLPYDDPFNPSTAPFKRLVAFDAVDASFRLYVKDPSLVPVAAEVPQSSDDRFYGDLKVELASDRHVRIPTVGPGTRLIHASARAGSTDIAIRVVRDGADNWFVDLPAHAPIQARLVLELAIPRATFGGDFADPDWSQLRQVVAVPPNVAESAEKVNHHIGVDRTMRPRDVIRKLVSYYRSFVDSDDPPRPSADVFSDLALSQKGVCRHRAFAFAISAMAIGIPARMVMNEAHAWVEVHDGSLWKRIDLGGAGRALSSDLSRSDVSYEAPPDPFRWPSGAQSGDDMADRARSNPQNNGGNNGGGNGNNGGSGTQQLMVPAPTQPRPNDQRPPSKVTLTTSVKEAVRGESVRVLGDIASDGETCGGVRVDIVLKQGRGELVVGSLATDEQGHFERSIVLPASLALGNYEVHARTAGDTRCGPGESQ